MKRSFMAIVGFALALLVFSVSANAADMFSVAAHAAHATPFAFGGDHAMLLIGLGGSIEQLRKLGATRDTLVKDMQAITLAAGKRDDPNLTDEERTKIDAATQQIGVIDGDIKRLKATVEASRAVELPDNARLETPANKELEATHGFRSFGEFAYATLRAGLGEKADERLAFGASSTLPTNYGNEGSGADGGYVVPPQYSTEIVQTAYNKNDSFLPMTDNAPVTGNGMTFPVDETTPWGTSGVKAFWMDEGAPATDSKLKLDPAQLRLKKLGALVPLTEEMMSDAAFLGAYVQAKVPEAISFKTNEALWAGSGAGKPKGFFNAAALKVSVAAEGSQVAATIVAANVSKMRARMSARSWARAIWQINLDCLPQLDALAFATTATNAQLYKPEGGKYGYGTLLGKDVMVTDFNETCGTVGDIALVDWGMYRTITKAAGVETATSMHFWFDRGLTAFRTIFRIDGQPAIQNPITPNKGSNTLSPIVVLAAR